MSRVKVQKQSEMRETISRINQYEHTKSLPKQPNALYVKNKHTELVSVCRVRITRGDQNNTENTRSNQILCKYSFLYMVGNGKHHGRHYVIIHVMQKIMLVPFMNSSRTLPTLLQGYRLLDSLVVECWHRVREVPGSIQSRTATYQRRYKNGT